MGLTVFNSNVDQLGIFGLLGGGENEGGVGGSILRLVFADCCGILVLCSQIEGGGELDSREDGKEVVLAAGYVHAKSPVAQELDSDREIRIRIKLTRITDNSLCNHTALASCSLSRWCFHARLAIRQTPPQPMLESGVSARNRETTYGARGLELF